MSDAFSPCELHEHGPNEFSITFTDEDHIEFLESQDGQGGGYSWEAMVKAALQIRDIELSEVEFDPESDMFAVVSSTKEPLLIIANTVRALCEDRALMEKAISTAKSEGYFE